MNACQTAIILHYVTSSPFLLRSHDSCELVGKDRKIAKISTLGNNALEERKRSKLIGHVTAYWQVRSPTSSIQLRYSFPCAIDSFVPPTISLEYPASR